MNWEHDKSKTTVALDWVRHLLILSGTSCVVIAVWRYSWIVAILVTIPIYVIMLNLCGFLTLPLYLFTPENRMKARMLRAAQRGDLEAIKGVTKEFAEKHNVKVRDDVAAEDRIDH